MTHLHLIGVDVGGTKVEVASLRGAELSEPVIAPTGRRDAEVLIDQIVSAVKAQMTPDVSGVGVGVPSVIEFATGRVKSSVNVPLRDVHLRQVLGERLGVPVFVDNDATCAAIAEAYEEEKLAVANLVMFTVGTGVGGGLILGGQVYRGATGAAGELGHTIIGADVTRGAPDVGAFPQPGSLESLAAGRELDRLAEGAGYGTAHELVQAAHGGDEWARELVALIGARLGVGIANAINTFDPDQVVIGGGAGTAAGDLLLKPAREVALSLLLPGVGEQTEIRLARWGPDAGVRGAALMAHHELMSQAEG
jgi:glucokinase